MEVPPSPTNPIGPTSQPSVSKGGESVKKSHPTPLQDEAMRVYNETLQRELANIDKPSQHHAEKVTLGSKFKDLKSVIATGAAFLQSLKSKVYSDMAPPSPRTASMYRLKLPLCIKM